MAIQQGNGSRDSGSNGGAGNVKVSGKSSVRGGMKGGVRGGVSGQAGIASKVAVSEEKPSIGKRPTQGIVGKLNQSGKTCSMGNGEIIKGVI